MKTTVRLAKRMTDLLFGIGGMTVSLPVMGAIALAIKATSRGPIFYKQPRAGMLPADSRGKASVFDVYKFRTMIVDAEKNTGVTLSSKGDPRITKIGGILRKTRLDELPQLLNVVKGDMSLIGPRPERPELLETLSATIPFFEERMRLVKPGITGLAQIKLSYTGRLKETDELAKLKDTLLNPFDLPETEGSTADDMRTKLLYDLAYSVSLENFWSFLKTDLEVILKTPLVMFLYRTGE